jgi:isochorismate pyruvate lyase
MKDCNSLEELRTEVDKVDDQIVDLIAERNRYIHQASKFKKSVDEIKSDDRIEAVLNRVRHRALTEGVSPNLVTEIYRKMIEEMVEAEIAEFRNTNTF